MAPFAGGEVFARGKRCWGEEEYGLDRTQLLKSEKHSVVCFILEDR